MPAKVKLLSRPIVGLSLTAGVVIGVVVVTGSALAGGKRGGDAKGGVASGQPAPLPTTIDDFFLLGTQPDPSGLNFSPILASVNCTLCHGDYHQADPALDPLAEPWRNWVGSMMGQSVRDPIFMANLTIANQDVAFGGDVCIRCHAVGAWLAGRSVPTDGSLFEFDDFDGVTCNFCHRLVDPVYTPGQSPIEDQSILANLQSQGLLPSAPGSGRYVVDPDDTRRGPFDDVPVNLHGVPIIVSPFHFKSELCGTCHDVENPVFMRQPDGTYTLTALGSPHPTQDKYDMFPIERTFSEWSQSAFASEAGVQMNGRFGGNQTVHQGVMRTCQDCHMPDQEGPGCRVPGAGVVRPNMPQHAFNGGNTWVLKAVRELYPDIETGLNDDIVNESISRAVEMLENASDMELSRTGSDLKVRIINYTGHKLPTGYHEGRIMWINVKFYNAADQLIAERGAYDFATGEVSEHDTKVYEAKMGLDAAVAAATGRPQGESFHFLLNNEYLSDNRIPPMGFTNANFASVQAAPVNYTYVDGQHWDDTMYAIPAGAAKALVNVYYQTTSKKYIEFLRDTNKTDAKGQIAYDQWVMHGRSSPTVMDSGVIVFGSPADLNGDGVVGPADLGILLGSWGNPGCGGPPPPTPCAADLNGDGMVGPADLTILLGSWG